ncbi:MAG: nucleoside triphosphate pyrophosphohydrolase [Corallococcus sp.]|nr:nucleoside triphosphate pyrophosphohydrolase [Corallococcus sp.]
MITVIGMGRKEGDLTLDGMNAIKEADVVVVKSRNTHAAKTAEKLRADVVYCDDLSDAKDVAAAIIKRLQSYGKREIAFCVVGEGADDPVVQRLKGARIVYGVSLYSATVGNVLPSGTVAYTAQELIECKRVLPLPTVVKGIDDNLIAGEVRVKLAEAFDDDCKCIVTCGEKIKKVALENLASQKNLFDYQTALFVMPKELQRKRVFDYYDCYDILRVLRGDGGCAWDRAQTHKSIVKNVIEEAYELANALEKEDVDNIIEELGDLLMQVLFHIEIGLDENEFEPKDVYSALCRKLIDRHPHVFGEVKAANADESLDVWNAQKLKEHKIKNLSENILDVPRGMSALMRSQKVQSRASKGGYDFSDKNQVIDKIREELQEFLNAEENDRATEGGDLLFAVVNLLRLSEVDSETALLLSTDKFTRRVVECERILAEKGKRLPDLPQKEFDEIWDEAKGNVG